MILTPVLLVSTLGFNDLPAFVQPNLEPMKQVLHDEMGGTRYAVGRTYKMWFDDLGARYAPRFGERAEKNLPLHFAFQGTPLSITRTADRVVLDRGSFQEIYDLGSEVVEQSFLIDTRSHDGDLAFRIPVRTELQNLEDAGTGLRFGREDLGEVRYGDATIVDAAGNRVGVESRRGADGIEITVPDSFLDRAVFPIVIDPILETIPVDTGTDNMRNPDVVYVDSSNVFIVVYERVQAGSDTDLLQRRYEADGDFLDEILIAGSTDNERAPAIAASGGNALTAFLGTTDSLFPVTRIRARNRVAGSTVTHAEFDVTGLATQNEGRPDVGGTTASTPHPFLITYSVATSVIVGSSFSIQYAFCSTSAVSSISSDASLPGFNINDQRLDPCVNQLAKAGGIWLVAYYYEDNPLLTAPEHDILGRALDPVTASFVSTLVDVSDSDTFVDEVPDVGGDGIDLLVSWHSRTGTQDSDIFARRFRFSSGTLNSLGNIFNLSDLDHTSPDSLDQLEPKVGYDGVRFVVTYREEAPGFDTFDLYASTLFATGTSLFSGSQIVLEKHTAIADTTSPIEFDPAIASTGLDSFALGKHFIAWTERNSTTDNDVEGVLYSSLGNGANAVTVQTGCGSPEPGLITTNEAVIGADYQILVANTNSPLLLIGTQTSLPLCAGQAGCTLGVSPLVMIPAPLIISTSIPADPAILGVPFALQVIDLLPGSATGSLCGPPKYSQKFRVSDTRVTTIR